MAKVALELELEQPAQAILKLPAPERQRLWSLLATLEEAHDPGALKALRESEQDAKEGRLYTFQEIFGGICLACPGSAMMGARDYDC